MAKVFEGRYSAEVPEQGAVLFLIGMRINQLWRIDRWFPVFLAMPRMIIELRKNPSLGLLSAPRTFVSGRVVLVQQYWRDFESLESYARNSDRAHLPAWRAFNRSIRDNGTVGIWHETYRVTAGSYETVYGNMPLFGLAGATSHVPASKVGQSAAKRIKASESDEPPVEPY
jgi:hypothetical protein